MSGSSANFPPPPPRPSGLTAVFPWYRDNPNHTPPQQFPSNRHVRNYRTYHCWGRPRSHYEIWNVVTPLREETLDSWGVVGEWLFGDQPEEILLRVAMPGQAFHGVKNLDGYNGGYCCFWRRILGRCIPDAEPNETTVDAESNETTVDAGGGGGGKTNTNYKPRVNLQSLPTELIWEILSHLDTRHVDDLYSLLLTSPLLCHITLPIFLSRYCGLPGFSHNHNPKPNYSRDFTPQYGTGLLGTWVNTPLLIINRVTLMPVVLRKTPRPTGVDWYEKIKSLKATYGSVVDFSRNFKNVSNGGPRLPRLPISRKRVEWKLHLPNRAHVHPKYDFPNLVFQAPTACVSRLIHNHPRRILSIPYFFPPGKEYVLRNLSSREYVRGNRLTDTNNVGILARHPRWGWGFGHVIASRVIYGEDEVLQLPPPVRYRLDSSENGGELEITEGLYHSYDRKVWSTARWVGHKFDVRVWEEVESELTSPSTSTLPGDDQKASIPDSDPAGSMPTSWKDVTLEAREHLELLWEVNGVTRGSPYLHLSTSPRGNS